MKAGMRNRIVNRVSLVLLGSVSGALLPTVAGAQELQKRLADISQASARNKQALAHYTWMEEQVIRIKGEVKKVQQFQVRMGVDGAPQKIEINPQAPPPPSGGRIRQHIVQKKTAELQDYGQQIAALGRRYAQIDHRPCSRLSSEGIFR